MKKLIFCFLTILLVNVSCDDEATDPVANEIETFKTYSTIQFRGEVMDKEIKWVFGNWENGIGAYGESYWCVADDKTIQQRNFSIYDYEKREDLRFLKIISPAIKTTDPYEDKLSVFEVGKKSFRLGDNSIYDGFIIEGNTKELSFSSSYGSQDGSSFEVVKIQELVPDIAESVDYKKIRLWIVVTCNIYQDVGQKVGRIENGKFIAELEIERNN
jgi:hypothetical protein